MSRQNKECRRIFESMDVPTRLAMAWGNVTFNPQKFFDAIECFDIKDVPMTRKNNVDKKNVNAPRGTFINARFLATIHDEETGIITKKEVIKGLDIRTESKKNKKGKRQENFPKQVLCVFSMGHYKAYPMFYENSIKIANCLEQPEVIMEVIWDTFISKHPEIFTISSPKLLKNPKTPVVPMFAFEICMKNLRFDLNMPNLDRSLIYKEFMKLTKTNEFVSSCVQEDESKPISIEFRNDEKLENHVTVMEIHKKPFTSNQTESQFEYKIRKVSTNEFREVKTKQKEGRVHIKVHKGGKGGISGRDNADSDYRAWKIFYNTIISLKIFDLAEEDEFE